MYEDNMASSSNFFKTEKFQDNKLAHRKKVSLNYTSDVFTTLLSSCLTSSPSQDPGKKLHGGFC